MSRPVKEMIAASLKERYTGVDGACVVGLVGLDIKAQEKLRCELRENAARMEVVKNSMARRAFLDTPLEPLGNALDGPCALVTTSQSLIQTAKTLVKAAKEVPELALKQAMVDGDPALVTIEELSKMKGRLELIGEVAMLITSPARAVAGCLRSPQGKIAGCLKAMIDKAA